MARIAGVSSRRAGPLLRVVYHFTHRSLRLLTGRDLGNEVLEPMRIYARIPRLLQGYARLEQATAKLHRLPKRWRGLAELKAATMTHCEYCIDLGSQIARRWGLSDGELTALASYRTSDLFDDTDKLVLDYAVAMSRTPVVVSDQLFAELRAHLDDVQLVELTHVIALENLRGRFNRALGIGSAGLCEGAVCAMPVIAEPID